MKGMIDRELEFDSIEQADRAMINLAGICIDLARAHQRESYLITAEQCIAQLDYDGDFVIRP